MINLYSTPAKLVTVDPFELKDNTLVYWDGSTLLFKNGNFYIIDFVENGKTVKNRRTGADQRVRVLGFDLSRSSLYHAEKIFDRAKKRLVAILHDNLALTEFENQKVGISLDEIPKDDTKSYMYYDGGLRVWWGFRDEFSKDENFGDPRHFYHCTQSPGYAPVCDPIKDHPWSADRIDAGLAQFFGTIIEGVEKKFQ